jgi:hypothetical protein
VKVALYGALKNVFFVSYYQILFQNVLKNKKNYQSIPFELTLMSLPFSTENGNKG